MWYIHVGMIYGTYYGIKCNLEKIVEIIKKDLELVIHLH